MPPVDPSKTASPKANTPPSAATTQYPGPFGVAAVPPQERPSRAVSSPARRWPHRMRSPNPEAGVPDSTWAEGAEADEASTWLSITEPQTSTTMSGPSASSTNRRRRGGRRRDFTPQTYREAMATKAKPRVPGANKRWASGSCPSGRAQAYSCMHRAAPCGSRASVRGDVHATIHSVGSRHRRHGGGHRSVRRSDDPWGSGTGVDDGYPAPWTRLYRPGHRTSQQLCPLAAEVDGKENGCPHHHQEPVERDRGAGSQGRIEGRRFRQADTDRSLGGLGQRWHHLHPGQWGHGQALFVHGRTRRER